MEERGLWETRLQFAESLSAQVLCNRGGFEPRQEFSTTRHSLWETASLVPLAVASCEKPRDLERFASEQAVFHRRPMQNRPGLIAEDVLLIGHFTPLQLLVASADEIGMTRRGIPAHGIDESGDRVALLSGVHRQRPASSQRIED